MEETIQIVYVCFIRKKFRMIVDDFLILWGVLEELMSRKKTAKFLISCILSIFFLYLAFRNVEFRQLADVFIGKDHITYWWTIPFIMITMGGMYFRAVRWRWI